MFLCGGLVFWAAGSSGQPLEQLEKIQTIDLRERLDHVQGIDIEGSVLWISSVDSASRRGFLDCFDLRTGRRLLRVDVSDGDRFHPGGIAVAGNSVWMPVAEYRRNSTAWIERRNKQTLALISRFEVRDHIGCVAVNGNRVFGGNWDSREIYEWDFSGRVLAKRSNPSENHYQDMKFEGGRLVASGVLSRDSGAIDWLEPRSLTLIRRMTAGMTDRGVRFNNEGMAIRGKRLYLAPEDGNTRVFVYRLP